MPNLLRTQRVSQHVLIVITMIFEFYFNYFSDAKCDSYTKPNKRLRHNNKSSRLRPLCFSSFAFSLQSEWVSLLVTIICWEVMGLYVCVWFNFSRHLSVLSVWWLNKIKRNAAAFLSYEPLTHFAESYIRMVFVCDSIFSQCCERKSEQRRAREREHLASLMVVKHNYLQF